MTKMEIEAVLLLDGKKTEEFVREYLQGKDAPGQIISALSYSFFSGGKRIRPSLMIECGKMLGLSMDLLLPFAAAIEMIHTYSLIHDDLPAMDNDDMRRGKPSNHKVFGEAQAILAGDALLNLSIEVLLDNADFSKSYFEAAAYLFKGSGICGMIGGQSLDMDSASRDVCFDGLKRMHMMKTGALINSCCICPAMIAHVNNDILTSMQNYANELGLIFQITDDILDFTGTDKELGKTAGKDVKQGKSTYITMYGYDKAVEMLNKHYEFAREAIDKIDADTSFLKGFAEYIKNRNH